MRESWNDERDTRININRNGSYLQTVTITI